MHIYCVISQVRPNCFWRDCNKFAFAVPWYIVRLLLVLGALTALIRKIDILYVVLAAVILSVIIF